MIARLLCRLVGHRWGPWEHLHGHVEHRDCLRCQEYEVRRTRLTFSEEGAFFYGPLFSAWKQVGPRTEIDPIKHVLDHLFPHVEACVWHRDTGEKWMLAEGVGAIWEIVLDLPATIFPRRTAAGLPPRFRQAYVPSDPDARGTVELALVHLFEDIANCVADEARRAAAEPTS